MKKTKKFMSMMAGVIICLTLTACPNPDPTPTPNPNPVNPIDGPQEWVMTAQTITTGNGITWDDYVFTYDAKGLITSRIDRSEGSHYNFEYTSDRVVISGTERCSYTLTDGLITSGGMEDATFKYDSSNHLILAEDRQYRTTLKWSGERLVSMEVIDLDYDEAVLAIKFKYRKANGIHEDCCRVFNSYFIAMMPQGYMVSDLCAAGLFGAVPSDEIITGYDRLYDFGDPDEESLDVYYVDNIGNGRPSEARYVYPKDTDYCSYTWGKI